MTLIEDLLDVQYPETIKLSPNCQQVLYSTEFSWGHKKGEHNTTTIWLADTGHANSSRQLTSGLYNDHWPRWNPDGNSIAFVSDRAKPSEQSSIYVLPLKGGGEPYPLTPAENEGEIACFEFSPDGKFIAYASPDEKTPEKKAKEKNMDDPHVWGDWRYNRLRLVDVATKKVTTLVSHDAHVDRIAWSSDGSKIAFGEKSSPDLDATFRDGTTISIIDVASQQIRQLCVFPSQAEYLTWAEDDTIHFLGCWTAESIISSQMVYSIDLSAEKPQYAKCAHGEENCARRMKNSDKDVTLLVEHGMESQIRMLGGRVAFSRWKDIIAWDAAFTTDSDEMIIAVGIGDSGSPPEIFTVTASGGAMVQLSNHGQALKEHQFGVANFLRCRSDDDDVDLDAFYVTPSKTAGKPSKPLPTMVFPHGGPYFRAGDSFNPSYHLWSNILVNAGYGVLFPNYRGSSGRGEKFASWTRGGCGTVEYDDTITLTDHAIKEGYADKDNLLIAGWSQGGFLSFIASVRNGMHGKGWKFKAAIPGAGISEADAMILTSDIGFVQANLAGTPMWKLDKTDTSNRSGSALWEFRKAVEEDVIPPMLILHGEEDKRVPLSQAVGFRRALDSIGAPYEMVTYPREPHMFRETQHIVDMAGRVLKFVDAHIGGGKS